MGVAEVLAVEAQDIRHFPSRSFDRQPCRPMGMGRCHAHGLPELREIGYGQQIQRALGGPELLARDL
jgi:hypothetical protein